MRGGLGGNRGGRAGRTLVVGLACVALSCSCGRRSSHETPSRPRTEASNASSAESAPSATDPTPPAPPGSANAIRLVESEDAGPTTARFEGAFTGEFSATPLDGPSHASGDDEPEPASRFFRLTVRLEDGRTWTSRFARGERFERVVPFGISEVGERVGAFAVFFAEVAGEDCVTERVSAFVLEPSEGALSLVGRGIVGDRSIAFDQCGDWPDFDLHAEGDRIRVDRRVLRIVTTDPPTPEGEEALREMREALDEARARHRTAIVDASERHVARRELRALRDAQDAELDAIAAEYAFDAERPYLLCRFPRMATDCEALPPREQSFVLGDRPPAL